MDGLEKIPSKGSKWTERQKRYNSASKSIIGVFGANISLYICILIPVLLIGFIWTDIGAPEIGIGLVSDGLVTVALFITGEMLMQGIGADGGKLDPEYIAAKAEHKGLVERVNELGTMLMHVFCEWQIDLEYDKTVNAKLRSIAMSKDEFDSLAGKSRRELHELYGARKTSAIISLMRTAPIELNEGILMYPEDEYNVRGGVPLSGDAYLRKKSRSPAFFVKALFTCGLTLSFAITLTADISFARVVYTAFKLVMLMFRMAKGYARGAKAYNTVEVVRLKAMSSYLRQYITFVADKIYLKLNDKYGDVNTFLSSSQKISQAMRPISSFSP